MNPQMMAEAQKMMAKMSPEDIRRMQEMAKNMDPNMMRQMQQQMTSNPAMLSQAARAMESMTPEQIRQNMEQAATMTPEQLSAAQASTSGMHFAPPPQPPKSAVDMLKSSSVPVPPSILDAVDEAERLKATGNKRFQALDFDGAVAKYDAALKALADSAYEAELSASNLTAVRALADTCLANSAQCHLKKGANAKAVAACSAVLERSPAHRKALYYRGKAHLAQADYKPAVADLKAAHRFDRNDATVKATLDEALAARKKAQEGQEGVGEASDESDDEPPGLDEAPRPSGIAQTMSPAEMEQAKAMMATMTPAQIKAQVDMISQMDPAFLKSVDPRFKDMSAEMIKASLDAARNIDPAQLAQMQQMMGGMGGMGGMMGGMGGMMGGMPPGAAMDGMSAESAAAMLGGMPPEMMAQATNMMKSLDPAAMAQMLSSSTGRNVSTAEAKAMQEQLAKVDPETMQRWLGRAALGYSMWTWLKASARQMLADPRRAAVEMASAGKPLVLLTAVLTATFAALLVGHVGGLY